MTASNTAVASGLRPELEDLPCRLRKLPVVRGFPVPWFVAWIDGQPEFRAMDPDKLAAAVQQKLCWVCGEPLGKYLTFVVGPMCGVNRISAEPPCHLECAEWSARNCPFLSRPHMVRREDEEIAALTRKPAGIMIPRNPGVTLLWTTTSFTLVPMGHGVLFEFGHPHGVLWYHSGKYATREQVVESVESGLPALMQMARLDGAEDKLLAAKKVLESLYPPPSITLTGASMSEAQNDPLAAPPAPGGKPQEFQELVSYLGAHPRVVEEDFKGYRTNLAFLSCDLAGHLHFKRPDGKTQHTPAGGPCGPQGHKPELAFFADRFEVTMFGMTSRYFYSD